MRVSLVACAAVAVAVPTALAVPTGLGRSDGATGALRPQHAAVVVAAAPVATPQPRLVAAPPVAAAPDPGALNAAVLPKPIPPAARRVLLYGDSLAWEARGPFTATLAAAGITQVTTRTFGGTAICDWFDQMRADEAAIQPDAVVVEFSGNALTPCMKALDGSPLETEAYFAKYLQDAQTVRRIFPMTTTLYFAGSPITLRATLRHDPTTARLNWIYAALSVTSPNVRYIDAGAAVTLHGAWTHTLPCLPGEPCTGGTDTTGTPVDVVRAPDGAHFCPVAPPAVRGVVPTCPVYSAGADRFGTAMADPVIRDLVGPRAPGSSPANL